MPTIWATPSGEPPTDFRVTLRQRLWWWLRQCPAQMPPEDIGGGWTHRYCCTLDRFHRGPHFWSKP